MMNHKLQRMEWEKPYLEALIDNLHPFGRVLEVGFGLGYSACRIQTYPIEHHTIIESNPRIAEEVAKWAENNQTISLLQDTWEDALPKLGIFDTIFFNDFEPDLEAEKIGYRETGSMIVQKGKELINKVKQELPELMNLRYLDSDLDDFYHQVGQFQLREMGLFLSELKKNGQISLDQYEKMVEKYRLEKTAPLKSIERQLDPMLVFLETCLNNHMRKGSRFSCFASSPISKYENPEFFASIITNPNVDYQEKVMAVEVPKSCTYYKYNEALIITIEKI